MNLIINQMVQFQIMHVSDGNGSVKELAGTSIAQAHFTIPADGDTLPQFAVLQMGAKVVHNLGFNKVFIFCLKVFPCHIYIIAGKLQGILNIILVCSVKDRRGHVKAQCLGSKA